VILKFRIDN